MLHGGSLRGPPIPPASGRRQFEGKENGGLDVFKTAVIYFYSGMGNDLLNDGFFSFAVVRQIGVSIKLLVRSNAFQNYLACT